MKLISSIENKVSWIIITIVIMGFVWSLGYHLEWWPKHNVTLWNGELGFRKHWHIWLNMHYIIGFLLIASNFISKTELDKDFLKSFLIFDIFGWLSYNYKGWPEPVYLFIIGFSLSVITFGILRLCRH